MGKRAIAKALKMSRNTVREIIASGSDELPTIERKHLGQESIDTIRELYIECQGNLVRVQEELEQRGLLEVSYSTLTSLCRRYEIGTKPKTPKGHYHFEPGQEIQHDTSPHDVEIGGKLQRVQCASAVLCFSRNLYAQVYPTFNRFYCKVFLTEAFEFFGGAAKQVMIDNTHVIIAHGTGKDAVPAPEMAAFAERFDTQFIAHEVGDANRSARVEGPFYFIERNFYPGRTFKDFDDLNRQFRKWCEDKLHRFIRTIQARPIELFQTEQFHLKPLPAYIPEVYALHQRMVDLEGYVHLHTNSYSVPPSYIGRRLEVRETKGSVKLFEGARRVAEHPRQHEGSRVRTTLPEHCPIGRHRPRNKKRSVLPEEAMLRVADARFTKFLDLMKKKHGCSVPRIRRLHRCYIEYPTGAMHKALEDALTYGLTDLERLERMILRNIAGDYFRLADDQNSEPDND